MAKHLRRANLPAAAAKVKFKSAADGISEQHINQNHNTQKEALGPNTER